MHDVFTYLYANSSIFFLFSLAQRGDPKIVDAELEDAMVAAAPATPAQLLGKFPGEEHAVLAVLTAGTLQISKKKTSTGDDAGDDGFGGGAKGTDLGRGARQIGLVKVVDNPLGLRMLPKLMSGSDLLDFFSVSFGMIGTFIGQLEHRKHRKRQAKILAMGAMFGLSLFIFLLYHITEYFTNIIVFLNEYN